jgi:hypothetical protein
MVEPDAEPTAAPSLPRLLLLFAAAVLFPVLAGALAGGLILFDSAARRALEWRAFLREQQTRA